MRRRELLLGGAALAVELVAKPALAAPKDPLAVLEERLTADTGCDWAVNTDYDGNVVTLLALGKSRPIAVGGRSKKTVALTFLARYGGALGAPRIARELELMEETAGPRPESTMLRFVQRIPGSNVRVVDHEVLVEFDSDGAMRKISLEIVKNLSSISPHPKLTPLQAQRRVWPKLSDEDRRQLARKTKLIVHRSRRGRGRLAYRIDAEDLGEEVVTVDANTGAVVNDESNGLHDRLNCHH
jgi:hypothetical protein